MEVLNVIFRADKSGGFKGMVTAVFPTETESNGMAACYAHVGQHGSCSREWYKTTRPALPIEYKDLLTEMQSIYEGQPDCIKLKVIKRWNR